MLPNSLYLRPMKNILITTTPIVENRPVLEYLGIVSGVAFTRRWGLVFNDTEEVESVLADTPWGRAWSEFKANLHKARDWAIQQMAKEAASLGANAVIGVKIDYKITGKFSGDFEGSFNYDSDRGRGALEGEFGMGVENVWVIATGTAVRL
jgi:uncharacterized protein YbjQ (UPF0145 family)